MPINYRIYSNHGTGGPVDFSAPLGVTSGLNYTTGPVGAPSDTTYVVRAFDPGTGLEEANTEARVRVVISRDGNDFGPPPGPPHAVTVSALPGGGCRVGWAYAPADGSGVPDGFRVYVTPPASTDPPPPAAAVAYAPGRVGYAVTLPAPPAPAEYVATVGAFNRAGESPCAVRPTASLGAPTAPFDMDPISLEYV